VNDTIIHPKTTKEWLDQKWQEKYQSEIEILLWLVEHLNLDIAKCST
jgi:hypothetical protein